MLSCLIDGQARTIHPGSIGTISAMLDELNGDLASSGRFISSLRVNGVEIESIDEAGGRELEEDDSVEITTDTSVCLAGKILDEAQNYIDALNSCISQAAGSFSSGSEAADGLLAEAVQGLQWFVQMTDFIETTLKIDFRSLALDGRCIADYVNNLNDILMDIVNAQEAGDPVLLADVLEYDLVPHLEIWKSIYTLFEEGYRQ